MIGKSGEKVWEYIYKLISIAFSKPTSDDYSYKWLLEHVFNYPKHREYKSVSKSDEYYYKEFPFIKKMIYFIYIYKKRNKIQ